MTPDRFQQIEELYHAAHEATAEERAALLAQTDPELRREVELLLRSPPPANFWTGLPCRRSRTACGFNCRQIVCGRESGAIPD